MRYATISKETFQHCVEQAFVVTEERNRRGRLIRRHVSWDEDTFKQVILEEVLGAKALASLDSGARERVLAEISEQQYGPMRVPTRAERRRWLRAQRKMAA